MEKAWKDFNKARRESGSLQVSYSNYMKHYRHKNPVKPAKKTLYAEPLRRESPKIPSGDMFDSFKGSRKKENTYTGDNLLGIATMHKSNSVPVFNRQDAEDIANMRRN